MKTLLTPLLSHFYKKYRARVIRDVYARQQQEERPQDLEEVVQEGDGSLKFLRSFMYKFFIPDGIGVQFHDLYFPSPLTLAAFKDDLAVIDIWMRLGLGGACLKTVMKESRQGNPRPRLQEVAVNGYTCLLNAMGLPGSGVEDKIQELETTPLFRQQRPIGLSIGGNPLVEYRFVFDKLNEYIQKREDKINNPRIALAFLNREPLPERIRLPVYFEINSSCPNTPEGQQMTKHPELLEELVRYMRSKTDKIIGAKLSPDSSNEELVRFAELMLRHEKTYVNLGNTTFRKCIAVGLPANAISIGGGGLSGPVLFERTLEMVEAVAPTGINIIATGGIDSAQKVLELQEIGYLWEIDLLVGMATAVVQDMYCIPRINRQLARSA